MYRRIWIAWLFPAILLVSAPFAATQPTKIRAIDKDRAALLGKWITLAFEQGGKVYEDYKTVMITIDRNKIYIAKPGHPPMAIVALDPDKTPKTIDFRSKDQKILGIYELEDGTLKLCYDPTGNERPADFTGKRHGFWTLRLSKGGDTRLILGKWEVTAVQENGVASKEKAKVSFIFFEDKSLDAKDYDGRIKVMTGDKVTNEAYFSLGDPNTIDIVEKWDRDERVKQKRAMLGIYDLDSDTLKLCIARQSSYDKPKVKDKTADPNDREKERPAKLVSTKDAGLITLKRVRMERGDLFNYRDKEFMDPDQDRLTLQQIAAAMRLYEVDKKAFPAAAICDAKGTPLLSWRVALLPYIDQKTLHGQFKLDEPWDSEHNKKLLIKMPDMYFIPNAKTKLGETKLGETHYRVIAGDGTGFDMVKSMKAADIKDGLAGTMMVVQAAEAVPWTKPDELVYAAKGPLPDFADLYDNGMFLASFFDGRVKELSKFTPEKTLRALITRAGGEKGPFDYGPAGASK